MNLIRLVLAASFACLAMPVPAQPCAGFTDVQNTDPFCPDVTWIRNRNVTLGCAAGLYCPETAVSRLSLAAFLNRLGNVLLPPNVIWVAPVGGQFQSIQAAIDYAASLPGSSRRLVKVAPGTYSEAVVMAAGVDVEGSGPDATAISSVACSSGAPTRGTVTGAPNSQLRDLTVLMDGSAEGLQCAAIYLDAVRETPLRNVRVDMRVLGGGLVYGVVVTATTLTAPWGSTLEEVRIDTWDLGGPRTGILIDGGAPGHTLLRNVTVSGTADTSPIVGLRVLTGEVTLDQVGLRLSGSGTPGLPAVALQLAGGATANVERSALRAGYFADVAAGATLRVAHSMLEGALVGAAACFSNYGPSFASVTC